MDNQHYTFSKVDLKNVITHGNDLTEAIQWIQSFEETLYDAMTKKYNNCSITIASYTDIRWCCHQNKRKIVFPCSYQDENGDCPYDGKKGDDITKRGFEIFKRTIQKCSKKL